MDLSVAIPGIRTHKWEKLYESLKLSCRKYSWELIFAGPFDPPPSLSQSVRFVKTYACPSVAVQLAAGQAEGTLYVGTNDDVTFVPDALDGAVDQLLALGDEKAIINLRYTEGDPAKFHATNSMSYWTAAGHAALHLPGVPRHYQLCLHPLIYRHRYVELGGLDCAYEYPNFNLHDFAFRAQFDGSRVHHSTTDISNDDHVIGGDHAVIEDACQVDAARFFAKYGREDALRPETVRIPFDNWKEFDHPWHRRFSTSLPNSYQELADQIS